MKSKTCTKCNKTKLLKEFNPSVASRDGRRARCKICTYEAQRGYRYGDECKLSDRERVAFNEIFT